MTAAAVAETSRANGSVCTCSGDRAGALLRLGVRLTVGLLAVVAAVSSFGHMNELAIRHGQVGWQALVFPVSVDGLELVAALALLLEHRQRGKATSPLAWFALTVATAASVGANIAVGPPDLVGRGDFGLAGGRVGRVVEVADDDGDDEACGEPELPRTRCGRGERRCRRQGYRARLPRRIRSSRFPAA